MADKNNKVSIIWNKDRPWLTPGLSHVQSANLLGEVIYPKIHVMWTAEKDMLPKCVTADKITGMIVELPIIEGDPLATDDVALKAIYEQAKTVLLDFHNSNKHAEGH